MSNKGVVKLFKYTWKGYPVQERISSSILTLNHLYVMSPTLCPHVYSAPQFYVSKFKNLISKFHRNLETIIFNENIISSIKDEIIRSFNHSIRSESLIMIMRLQFNDESVKYPRIHLYLAIFQIMFYK